jgi:SHAQKYF class myb-like DNA-binding protein
MKRQKSVVLIGYLKYEHLLKYRKQHDHIKKMALAQKKDLELEEYERLQYRKQHERIKKMELTQKEVLELEKYLKEERLSMASDIARVRKNLTPPESGAAVVVDANAEEEELNSWTAEEDERFAEALAQYGHNNVKAIAAHVGTRNVIQVRTHLHKHQMRLKRQWIVEATAIANPHSCQKETMTLAGASASFPIVID